MKYGDILIGESGRRFLFRSIGRKNPTLFSVHQIKKDGRPQAQIKTVEAASVTSTKTNFFDELEPIPQEATG
jgi:hypothetical protein